MGTVPPAIQIPTSIPTIITIKNVGIHSAAVLIIFRSTSFHGIFNNRVVITDTITPEKTDSVVLHPMLIIIISTAIITKNETIANSVVGSFLS